MLKMNTSLVLLLCCLAVSHGALTILSNQVFQTMLTKMWQRELNTTMDPANNKWYTNGANGDGKGLYGGLVDHEDNTVYFIDAQKKFSTQQFTATTATVNNKDGLTPTSTVTLSYTHSYQTSQSHAVSNSFSTTAGVSVKASATIFGLGVDVTTSFTFAYTYSLTATSSSTTTDTTTFSQAVPMTIPKGKIYQAVMTGTTQTLTVPTTSRVTVTGTTETWFGSSVKGHVNWIDTAGEAFDNIRNFGIAGASSPEYTNNNGVGVITVDGEITGLRSINFQVKIVDITGMTGDELSHMHATASIPEERLVEVISY